MHVLGNIHECFSLLDEIIQLIKAVDGSKLKRCFQCACMQYDGKNNYDAKLTSL